MGELLGRCRRRRRRRRRRDPRDSRRPPATPRDVNIGADMDRTIHFSRIGLIYMDRTIHYFQDGTDIWIVRSTISRIGLS